MSDTNDDAPGTETTPPPTPEQQTPPPATTTPPPAEHHEPDNTGERLGTIETAIAHLTSVVESLVPGANDERPGRLPWTHWGGKRR